MMNLKKIWESNLSLILLLWIIIAVILRPGWPIFGLGFLGWIGLVYLTAPGVFWNYAALFAPNPLWVERLLGKAVSCRPSVHHPYLTLGLNYARRKQWAEAIPLLEQAVELAPPRNQDQNRLWLAEAYRTAGDIEKALPLFEALRQKGFAPLKVSLNLALIHLDQKRFQEALEYAEQARTGDLSAMEPVLIIAKTHFLMGEYQQAKDDYLWVIERLKWPVESFYWLGRAELELGEFDSAIAHLQTAVERITEDPLLSDVSKEEAEEWLERALKKRKK